ncbi:hypothetical protein GCM10017783_21020 [Deinococcus piscis]|uniref:Pyridoxamine 5'-phosphate oxidase family protein n=1 Tax=Deinococcus piscis TaxID=394230 RepID=A0ABQ3KB72_9DEIO|nr:pyridoxamine 5'-phosphate oxidase family protein [Deinococcus piscis]GHG08220.1 hypothetical protein GCM10017783_21020 [Deinococcus piscis]
MKEPPTGQLKRQDKAMNEADTSALLSRAFCGRTATIGADGYPYAVPNLFVWMDGQIYLHTARYAGHFLTNVRHYDKVCFEVDEAGEVYPYGHIECDTSVAYVSAVVFGHIRIVEDEAEQIRFYTAFMDKYAPADSWGREQDSFPRIGGTVVYAITPHKVTGKLSPLPVPAERWPAKNDTASPGWTGSGQQGKAQK